MQINATSPSISVPVEKITFSRATTPPADQAVLQISPNTFSSLVNEARQLPEVRSELVDAFKSRIQSGHYPPPEIIDGLTRLIGGGIMQQAAVGSSTTETQSAVVSESSN